MTLYNKIKWVIGILMIFVLIIVTNLVDRNNFLRVKDSMVTIYEDRLIANDLIFEMSRLIHQKEVAWAASDSLFLKEQNPKVNNELRLLVERFEETKLTNDESAVFEELKLNIELLNTNEQALFTSKSTSKNNVNKYLVDVQANLYDLAKIQLNEGGRQVSISKKAVDTVELLTQIEISILIFLAILIQIIVMYNPSKKKSS